MFAVLFAAALTLSRPSLPLPTFAFAGRVTDYAHVAYDADQRVEIRVLKEDGTLLAKGTTGTNPSSVYNFVVEVPVSDLADAGSVTPGTRVVLEFVDPNGQVFRGLVAAGDATVGLPGEVKKLVISLGTDANGNRVPDEYEAECQFLLWAAGRPVVEYDPEEDWDGDGVKNFDEFVAGTNPLDADDRFSVRQMAADAGMEDYVKLVFPVNQGRVYTLEAASVLDGGGDWRQEPFLTADGRESACLVTSGGETGIRVIFVKKKGSARFWRLKTE